uniref:AIG1-type G domain-containing protein n=1 Tax=Rhizophagus irregularis (strain DAOM 181602 / DAOM 197198 / MUCL 43194) TaxID=747089 RepID=U9UQ15_RHIID
MTLELRSRMLTDPYSTAPAILLFGKTGAGKSTLANMLIGEEKFQTSDGSDSLTQICQSTLININGKEYNLVDTPGIFDTQKPDREVLNEIAQSIVQCCHGISAILYVLAWEKIGREFQDITNETLKFLGQESCRHIIVVFTKCKKEQTEDRVYMENNFNINLKSFMDKVGNRWVISPNLEIFKRQNDPVVERHMDDLKHYIRLMPNLYTTELFDNVRIAREKELQEIESNENKTGLVKTKVILANGKRIEASQLSIGDKVFCGEKNGKLIFSEIYAIIHADNQTDTQYQRIDYLKLDGTEGTLRLTPKHHLFVSQGKTIFAEDVRAHETELLLFDGKKLIPVIPHRVTREWELGYTAPFTQSGKIVVDDILCSCYAVAPPYQAIIDFVMISFRLYSWIMPTPECSKEIHPYIRYLKRGQWILEQIDYFNMIIKRS